jgi:hypothetical protein
MSEEPIRTITIKAMGELNLTPDVVGLFQSCVKMNSEHGKETGDFYFENLHVQYSYAEHKVTHVKHGGRKKKSARELEIEDFNHSYPN